MEKIFNQRFIIIWDTEYTSWEGCNKNGWDPNKNQYMELVQIGAILVDTSNYSIKKEFLSFVKPTINPKLSKFFKNLTGIEQSDVDSAQNSMQVISDFLNFVKDYNCYSYGNDVEVLLENIRLHNLNIKINNKNFHDVREIFKSKGISTEKYCSGNITEAFGVKNKEKMHNALFDAKSILEGLKILSIKNR